MRRWLWVGGGDCEEEPPPKSASESFSSCVRVADASLLELPLGADAKVGVDDVSLEDEDDVVLEVLPDALLGEAAAAPEALALGEADAAPEALATGEADAALLLEEAGAAWPVR